MINNDNDHVTTGTDRFKVYSESTLSYLSTVNNMKGQKQLELNNQLHKSLTKARLLLFIVGKRHEVSVYWRPNRPKTKPEDLHYEPEEAGIIFVTAKNSLRFNLGALLLCHSHNDSTHVLSQPPCGQGFNQIP